jgi:uncharacterized protein YciI
MSDTQTFIVLIRPNRATFANDATDGELKIVSEHFDYLKKHFAEGKLILVGPCEDAAFGVIIFEVESEEIVRGIMADDPAIKAGVFLLKEIHPFRISLMRR